MRSDRIPRKFCGNCRSQPVDYPRCICLLCEQEQREIDHNIIMRAPVLVISDQEMGNRAWARESIAVQFSSSGRPILTLRKRA